MSMASVCKFVKRISVAVVHLERCHIQFPEPNDTQPFGNDFQNIAQMPGVIGCVDGMHIKIQSPGGENAEIY